MEGAGRWIALIARTPAEARDSAIEGPGGILRNTHPNEVPHYEPSKKRLTWRNGTRATIYSDEEPDQLRSFSGDTAWIDEFGKFKHPRLCWINLQFGMREVSADRPRRLITSTPRPLSIIREIEKMATTITITGNSYENQINLDPTWFKETILDYEGTRIGRQEIYAEMLGEAEGALWKRGDIHTVLNAPQLTRIVVAIDPAATSKETSDETGIIVAGVTAEGLGYVLEDLSGRYSPDGWASRAIEAYSRHKADRIIGEVNNGGEMIESVLRTIDKTISYKSVHASRGKAARAEPIAALYERGKVYHVGGLNDLEDQLCNWEPLGGDRSPDRLDADVWALTELMIKPSAEPRIRRL